MLVLTKGPTPSLLGNRHRSRGRVWVCVWSRLSRPAQLGCITSLLQMPRLNYAHCVVLQLCTVWFKGPCRHVSDCLKSAVFVLIAKAAVLMHRIHGRSPQACYKRLCCFLPSSQPPLPGRVRRLLIFCPGPLWFISSPTQRRYFIQSVRNAFVLSWLTCLRSTVRGLFSPHNSG